MGPAEREHDHVATLRDDDLEDSEELDVSAVVVDRLLSGDHCLVDQLEDRSQCGSAEDEDDHNSLVGTFIGDEDGDDELLSGRSLLEIDDPARDPELLAAKRSDSVCSAFSTRDTLLETQPQCSCGRASAARRRSASAEYLDAEIRQGLDVRVVAIESAEMNSRFVLRVEDLETGKTWETRKSTKQMAQFYNQIRHICMDQAPVKKEMWGTFRSLRKLRLPKKFFHSRGALCYQRKVVYDSLLRHTAALALPAPLGPRRRRVLLLLQEFLEVASYCDLADREVCNCWFFSNRVNASQLIAEIFSDSNHAINHDCAAFVATLSKKMYDSRRARLYPRQAQAMLRTIQRKMVELKKALLNDVTLLQQVGSLRDELAEDEFDDFVDDVRRAAAGFVQRAVLVELEDLVHEALYVLHADDEATELLPKVRALQAKSQAAFGIPRHLQSWSDWEEAQAELRKMDEYALPLDKLKCIVRNASAIYRSYSQDKLGVESSGPVVLSTDEFIQIQLYVVAKCALPGLQRTAHLLRLAWGPDELTGEMGYYFTNFEAAIQLIQADQEPSM
ncbi:hypothetical protein ATCC90586_009796 [Pythium insidiosum]|nr:hypothetical protein ATCC90586_009796 [Pythium insidiosum]